MLETYGDLPADFADASLIPLCERINATNIVSVDKDFTIYRTRNRKAVRNLFFGEST